jgi:RNA polymerase sigma-70 factor (ECF subfamily)
VGDRPATAARRNRSQNHQLFGPAGVFMSNADAELVIQFKQGDRKAFAMLVDRYQKPIYNTAYRMIHNADDAADITQAAFVKAYEKIDTYNPSYKFFNWLYKIAVNESINTINRRKRRRNFEYDPPAAVPAPDEDFALGEMSNLLQRALDHMKYDHRVVIVLKHLLLLPYSEIANILDLPEKTVKSRLFTARRVLREQLLQQGYQG